jgi:hypothetical protein
MGRSRGRRLAGPAHHRGLLLLPHEGESQGGHHEQNGRHRGQFGQKGSGAGGAEDRLAGAAEGRADAGALAVLQQDDENQGQADDDMDGDDESSHNFFNINDLSEGCKPEEPPSAFEFWVLGFGFWVLGFFFLLLLLLLADY